ncbi:peptidase M23B [Desulforamulus reducens MI-1]|uniref:Peptidase M23B n=1 Tax=Desulforamulus reducens (strain ATCC BAA-1160 / DSM 100696 / MI-1) TaxID=349161 RepID=A4J9C2_DESRM|nr:peptidoglycan DD-metalloendopeptidase family protein [Desulforamulus reducens]ABO51675.1 peptidase M23B [Desulforamulus reducens MI-1]
MHFHINKRKLVTLTIAVYFVSMVLGVLPASAGLDEVVSEGAYSPPLARNIEVQKPLTKAPKSQTANSEIEMEYQVRPGDSLWSIAERTGISVGKLAEINKMNPTDVLVAGRNLIIPGMSLGYHRIASGETLSHIAGQYDITMAELMKANGLANPDFIKIGATLVVPNREAVSEAVVSATSNQKGKIQIGGWAWPVAGEITSHFGIRGDRPHEGVDIGASSGATIVAAEQGRVVWAAPRGTYGLTVILDHGNGIRSLYAHCSKLLVTEGQQVDRDQPIARVGNTGRSAGPHLHMEILRQGIPLDPLLFLKERLFG